MKVGLSIHSLTSPGFKVIVAVISAVVLIAISAIIFSNKEVTLEIDGHTEQVFTHAKTVGDLLAEKDVDYSSHDQVKPEADELLLPGARVSVKHANGVVLNVNGKRRKVWVLAGRVGQAVEELGIDTSADIILKPSAGTKISSGMTIKVKLLNRWIEKIQTEIAFDTKNQDDSSLDKGKSRVAVKGKPGIKKTVVEHVMAGGQEVEKIVRNDKIVADPVDQVVKVGTRVPRTAVAAAPTRGGGAMSMHATAYAAYTGGAGNRTATGTGVHKGIVAVDPRVIPLGTKLYIDGYGPAVAADTGGAIKGNRIDLGFGSAGEAYQFGRQTVTVHVVE